MVGNQWIAGLDEAARLAIAARVGYSETAFGGYLRALALVDVPARVTIRQGQDMGRPSRLLVDLAAGDERVQVTGTADPMPAG